MTIRIANATPETEGRYVAAEISLDGKKLRKHTGMSNSYMYAIGSDGQLYQYNSTYSTAKELVTGKLPDGEKAINIIADTKNNISVLTDKGGIVNLAGGTNKDKYLKSAVSAATSENLTDKPATTSLDETGDVDTVGGSAGILDLLNQAVQNVKVAVQQDLDMQRVSAARTESRSRQNDCK